MSDSQFTYHGPPSGVSLCEGSGKGRRKSETLLHAGQTVALPADHPYVKRLIAQGRLVPVERFTKSTPRNQSDSATIGTKKESV